MFGGTSTFSSGFGPSDFGNTSDFSDTFLPPRKETSAKSTQEIKKQKSLPIHEISTSPFGEYTYFFIYIPQLFNIQLKLYKRTKNQKTIFFQTFLKIRVHPEKPPIITKPVVCVSQDPVINCGYALDFSQIPPKDLSSHCPVIELYYISEKGETLLGTAILPLKVNQVLNIYGKQLKYLYRNQQIDIEDFLSRKVGSALVTIALGFEEHIEYFRKIQTGSIPEELVPTIDENHLQNNQNAKITTTTTTSNTTTMKSSMNQFRQNAIDGDSVEYVKPQRQQQVYVMDDNDEDNEEEDEDDDNSKRRHRHHHRRHHKKRNKTDWVQQAVLLGWKPPGTLTGNWKEKAASKGWKPPIMKSSIALQFNYHDAVQLRDNEGQTDPDVFQQLAELNRPQEEEATSEISSSGVGSLINFLNGAGVNQPNPKHVMSQFEDESSALVSSDEQQQEQAKPKFEIIRPTQLFNHEPDFAESTNTLETTSDNLIDDLPDLDIVSIGTDSQLINHMSTDRGEEETQNTNKPILQTQHILSQKPLSLSDNDDSDDDDDLESIKQITNTSKSPENKVNKSPSPTIKKQTKLDFDDIDDVDDSDDSEYIEQLMKQLDVNIDSDDSQQYGKQKIIPKHDSDDDDDYDSDDDDARDVQRAMQKRYFGEI